MARKPELKPDFKFSFAFLKQKADEIHDTVQRDVALLVKRNVTNVTLTDFRLMITAFSNVPSDEQSRGIVSIVVEKKDSDKENLKIALRTIRSAAGNTHGEESAYYRIYSFEDMDDLKDNDLFRMARGVSQVTQTQLQAMAKEGITNQTVVELDALINIYDNALDTVRMAIKKRDLETQDRIMKGNKVFKEMTRLCSIAKDTFESTDEARYNDYLLHNTPSGEPEETPPGA